MFAVPAGRFGRLCVWVRVPHGVEHPLCFIPWDPQQAEGESVSTAFAVSCVLPKRYCRSISDNVSDEIIAIVCHQWPGDASHIFLLSCGDVPLCLLPV